MFFLGVVVTQTAVFSGNLQGIPDFEKNPQNINCLVKMDMHPSFIQYYEIPYKAMP